MAEMRSPSERFNANPMQEMGTAVKEKARDLAESASGMMSDVKDKAQEWASDAAEFTVQAKDRVQEYATSAAHKAAELGENFTDVIRRHPIPALLVAFGVGFLIAQATRRMS